MCRHFEHKATSFPTLADADAALAKAGALRMELAHLAARLRPGKGATNEGLTPRPYRERVAKLDALRAHLDAAEAAGVIA